jgi:hypothetical protein
MKYFFLFCATAFIMSCGGYKTATIQKSEQAFIQFTGTYDTLMVVIDGGKDVMHTDKSKVFQVSPGNHQVKVYKKDMLVVDRVIFIGNGNTMEVEVP